jgi:O-antigen ligase
MKRRGLAVLVGCVALGGFVSVAGPRYIGRMLTITNYEEDKSATGRLDSWKTGLRMMSSSPVFGIGFKRYVEEYHNFGKTYAREAHNSWVQLGAECGVIALSSHIALVILTLAALVRVRRRLPLLPDESRRKAEALTGMYEASLVGYLVMGSLLSMEDFEFFYLLVAMAQILDRVTEERVLAREAAGEEPGGLVPA